MSLESGCAGPEAPCAPCGPEEGPDGGGCCCHSRFAHEEPVARVCHCTATLDSKKSHESLLSSDSSLSPYSIQMVTEDPVVYYNYSIIGTFTVNLKVVAEWEQTTLDAGKGIVQKIGDFSASLKLQGGSWGAGAGGVLLISWPHWPLVKGTRHSGLCFSILGREETPEPICPWLW